MGSRLEENSSEIRKRIYNRTYGLSWHVRSGVWLTEGNVDTFDNEDGEEYEASTFGGFADYMRRKKIKLQNKDVEIRATSAGKPPIFRGVVAHVNGYTQPSLSDLHHLIVSHGGGFLQYLDGKTSATHIIASALTPRKREEFRKYRVVKPAWVVESIKAGRLLPWDEFRVIDEGPSQKTLAFENGTLLTRKNSNNSGYKQQTESNWNALPKNDTEQDREKCDSTSVSRRPDDSFSAETDYGDFPTSFDMDHEPIVEGNPESPRTSPFPDFDHQPEIEKSRKSTSENKPTDASPESGEAADTPAAQDETQVLEELGHETIPVRPDMSPEEYNALLLSDPRMRKSSSMNPDFIQQYYRESRLHHLSAWRAELKAKLQAITQEKAKSQAQVRRPPGARRYIMHVDFDCFFASVSIQKHHPEYADKPVAIAHGTGSSSEIASCNYPARKFGIKNGMWMKGALQQCPELKVLPYDFDAYEEASRQFYSCILDIDGVVQSVSIDEALVDITNQCLAVGGSDGRGISEGSIYREQAKADEIAQSLRDAVKEKTGCAVSVGIGGNVLQAKVALRKAKPGGQFQLKPDEVLDFIGSLTVQDLPGVGYSLSGKLEELGVKYVKDLRELSREKLVSTLGPKTGARLWENARGIDKTEVGAQPMRKSVSAEINWGIRFINQEQAEDFVRNLAAELHRRLVENLVKGKQLTLRVMRRSADAPLDPVKHLGHGKCDVFNKSVMIGVATNSAEVISKEAIAMLRSFCFSPGDIRGLGIQMTKLEPVKSTGSADTGSSQPVLKFAKPSPTAKKVAQENDPDSVQSPRKGDPSSVDGAELLERRPMLNDKGQKALNLTGTQFILPTQADPKVVVELPNDIRSRLMAKPKPREASPSPMPKASNSAVAELPPPSQLDPEILEALPEDVRAEVLEYYSRPAKHQPRVLPRSASPPPRKSTTPTKKRRGRPSKPTGNATLTQSMFNFVRPKTAESSGTPPREPSLATQQEQSEISEDILAELPEDIRQEILQEQRQSRMQQVSNLKVPRKPPASRPSTAAMESSVPAVQKRVQLPPLPEKPTFTSKKLTELPDLRNATEAWYKAFAAEGGPYSEDATALATYLRRVVLEERDIDKAVSVTNWLSWLVQDGKANPPNKQTGGTEESPDGSQPDMTWDDAVKLVQDSIQDAVRQRGLPPVEFS